MDVTGLQALQDVIDKLSHRGVTVVLSEANPRVYGKLDKAKILARAGHYFSTFSLALAYAAQSSRKGAGSAT